MPLENFLGALRFNNFGSSVSVMPNYWLDIKTRLDNKAQKPESVLNPINN